MRYVVYPADGGAHLVDSPLGGFDAALRYLELVVGVSESTTA